MKIRNIAFSGFMAAIMTSVAAAAPAKTIKVATQSYVDKKDFVVQEQVTQEIKQELTTNYVKQVDMGLQPGETVADKFTGVENRLTTAEGDITSLQDEINTLQGGVGSVNTQIDKKIGELDVAEIKAENEVILSVSETDGKISATTGKITESHLGFDVATQGELNVVSQAAADAAAAADANLESVLKLQDLLTVDGQLTSLGAAMNGISEKLANDFQVKLTGDSYIKIDAAGKIETSADSEITDLSEGLATSFAVFEYAVPKPSDECANGKNPCVLAINAEGKMEWMNVAFPSNPKTE